MKPNKPDPKSSLNITDRVLMLYILTKAEYLQSPGFIGSLFQDCRPQRNFLSLLLGLNPSSVRNPIKSRNEKTLLTKIMEARKELTESEINEYSRRLNKIKKLFAKNFYPKCIGLIDNRLHELSFMIPKGAK